MILAVPATSLSRRRVVAYPAQPGCFPELKIFSAEIAQWDQSQLEVLSVFRVHVDILPTVILARLVVLEPSIQM